MLIGQYSSKLTDKSRLAIPSKFRAETGDDLVIARWYERCLVVVPLSDWENLSKRLTGERGIVTQNVRNIDRFVSGMAYEVKVDNQGRFVVPEKLLDHAKITDEAVFVGLKDRIEVWSKESWEEMEEKVEGEATKAIEEVGKNK